MKIGIIGLGLMGGSIAKALRDLEKEFEIIVFSRSEDPLKRALEEKVIDKYTLEIDENFRDVDIVFICTPVNLIYPYVEKLSKVVKKDCVITDVGSTKYEIVIEVEKDFPEIHFVGGHPMAGTEKIGYEFSFKELYENKYYIITKTEKTKLEDIDLLKDLICRMKAIPLEVGLEEHDEAVATISHIPHVISAALVNLAKESKNKYITDLIAGGFKDTTRISSSSPVMWQNICEQNKEEILNGISKFKDIINNFENSLINNDTEEILNYFNKAKEYRDKIIK